tara:strand:+ start:3089 stop:3733 length:645 start_codon:yes stop_codon:yes gene_type:complete
MIIHTIGLEGCGHHGLENVIINILQKEQNYVCKDILNNSILQKSRNCDDKFEFKQNIAKYLKNKNYLIYTDDSYPSGGNRTIEQHKDIIEIYDNISEYDEIVLIYLKRDIYNTINSHPTHDGNIINHTKILKESKKYIENQITLLRKKNVNVFEINYEDIDNDIGITKISEILKVDFDIVKDSVNKNFRKSTKNYRNLLDINTIQQIKNILSID